MQRQRLALDGDAPHRKGTAKMNGDGGARRGRVKHGDGEVLPGTAERRKGTAQLNGDGIVVPRDAKAQHS